MTKTTPHYEPVEENFNVISHAIGIAFSLIGTLWLLYTASGEGNMLKIVSSGIFGLTLILMFSASTFYHASKTSRRELLNKFDHSAIYLLIAGTYTPFSLVTLHGAWGWSIFGVIWACAIGGIVFKLFFYSDKLRRLSAILYLVMGWIIVIAIKPLIENLPLGGLYWLMAGGLFYSLGVIFYFFKNIPFGHGIWHIFVFGGAVCHYFSILFFVV